MTYPTDDMDVIRRSEATLKVQEME